MNLYDSNLYATYIIKRYYLDSKHFFMSLRNIIHSKKYEYFNKLQLIDQHMARQSQRPKASLSLVDLMQLVPRKILSVPLVELIPFTTRNVMFNVEKKMIEYGEVYVLKVDTNVTIKIFLKIDERKTIQYHLSSNKGIIVAERNWTRMYFTVYLLYINTFTNVKLTLGSLQMEHKGKRITLSARSSVDYYIYQYVNYNRGRTAYILRNRVNRNSSRRRVNTCQYSRDISPIKTKRYFMSFYKQKSQYFHHVRKMSPDRFSYLKRAYYGYHLQKRELIRRVINLTLTIRFLENMKQLRIKDAKKKIRKIKIAMLCSDFVKIMKGRIRYKYTLQTRHNLALLKSIRFIVEVLQPNVLESARGYVVSFLKQFMDFQKLHNASYECQKYIAHSRTIQRYFRRKKDNLAKRVAVLSYHIVINNEKTLSAYQMSYIQTKYLSDCIKQMPTKSKTIGLLRNISQLHQALLESSSL